MPQSIAISLLVLGGVLLLIAILGGNFKIFGAEVSDKISSGSMRFLAGILGLFFIFLALSPGLTNPPAAAPIPASSDSPKDASSDSPKDAPPKDAPKVPPKPVSAAGDSPKPTSKAAAGIVFDPPSNVRVSPSVSAAVLCSVTEKSTISLLEHNGSWYSTDVCGTRGYIHQSQVKFSE